MVGQKRAQPEDFDSQKIIQNSEKLHQLNDGEPQHLMNDKILQSPSTALLSQNSNKRQVREIHFNVRDELGSQQIQCKPHEKVCRQTQLLDFLKKQIEKQPDPEINDIIAPIWNRTKTID